MKKKILAGLAALVVIAGFPPLQRHQLLQMVHRQGLTARAIRVMTTVTGIAGDRVPAMMTRITAILEMAIARDRAAAAGLMAGAVVRAVRIALPIALNSKPF